MNAPELISQLEARGASMQVLGDRLRIRPKSALTTELISELRERKAEILQFLSSSGWPAECLESEQRFRQPHARLFPLLDKSVETPLGAGRLVQVFADRAAVVLHHDQESLTFLLPEEVHPIGLPFPETGPEIRQVI